MWHPTHRVGDRYAVSMRVPARTCRHKGVEAGVRSVTWQHHVVRKNYHHGNPLRSGKRRCGALRVGILCLVAGFVAVWILVSPIPAVHAQGTGVGGLGSEAVDLSFDSTAFELRQATYWRNSMAPEAERVPNPNTILPSTLTFAQVKVASDGGSAASAVFKSRGSAGSISVSIL